MEEVIVDETTEELEFLEIDELFDEEESQICNSCRWRSFTSDDGIKKECSLLKLINRLAAKKGVNPLDDSFGCNRYAEMKKEEELTA